ncbi:FadR/GntR family transcriptional regulator [Flexivirga meconopsidis]|uniref:FadR/GntR family transcriptional regulator n=1 Tax=Flexivirga meconopsidis TaxID=2977121 RepID=UPI00223F03D3|nr:GntR family transcriptional regulator [Flexivirga meconopsidis]
MATGAARSGTPAQPRARAAVFGRIGDASRIEQVESRLIEAIVSGVLEDGERLPSEPELASLLGVSTITARHALNTLRERGLIETTRGRGGGSFVRRAGLDAEKMLRGQLAGLTRVDLDDRAASYLLIVTGCAELAAEFVDADDAALLREILPGADEGAGAWRSAEAELFVAIGALTRSARVTRQLIAVESLFGWAFRLPYAEADYREETRARFEELIDALAAGDGDAARRLMRQHLDLAIDQLLRLHAALRK